jgi:hypothetical protein
MHRGPPLLSFVQHATCCAAAHMNAALALAARLLTATAALLPHTMATPGASAGASAASPVNPSSMLGLAVGGLLPACLLLLLLVV